MIVHRSGGHVVTTVAVPRAPRSRDMCAPTHCSSKVFAKAAADGSQSLSLCGKVEAEAAGLSDAEAREFREELGIERAGLDTMIQRGYGLLGLQTYLTAGEMEVRA